MTRTNKAATVTRDPRWDQVVARDRAADGRFWYSVSTTGRYCRPSCPSRAANPGHVGFHATAAEARAAGFTPCLRCRPDEPSADAAAAITVARACRLIEAAHEPLALADLARAAGLSPSHFHRLFRRVAGVTPKAYADGCRAARVRRALTRADTVTEALYEAGFNSSGRFYAASSGLLGMTPGRYRSGGVAETLRFAVGACSLGAILVAASDRGIAAILLGDDPDALVRDLQDRFAQASLLGGDAAFEATVARVVAFVETPHLGLDLPLDVRGTAFQERVWQALRAIAPGRTATYTDIATAVGAPGSVRAVAGACAANTLAVAIPCHRVVRLGGALSGYRWGVERKRALLAREVVGTSDAELTAGSATESVLSP